VLRGIKKAVDIIEGRLMQRAPLAADATDARKKTFDKELKIFSTAEAKALHVLSYKCKLRLLVTKERKSKGSSRSADRR